MKSLGGKNKSIGKKIVDYLENIRKTNQIFLEPFLGGANIASRMSGERIAHDGNPHLAALWKAVVEGSFIYPTHQITEDEYKEYRKRKDQKEPDPMLAFILQGLSFGGKWAGGIARDKSGKRNYQQETERALKKKALKLQGVKISYTDYKTLNPYGYLIYNDPPYADQTQYAGVGQFDSNEFWSIVQKWAENNTVLVSEYKKPDNTPNIIEVLSIEHKLSVRSKNGCEPRVEKLFHVLPKNSIKNNQIKDTINNQANAIIEIKNNKSYQLKTEV